MKTIIEIRKNVEATYALLNKFATEGSLPLMDLAYPNHDGEQDAEAVSEMMLLRDSLNGLKHVCEMSMDALTKAIGDE